MITGYSTDEEVNSLEKKRADYVKKLLIGIGIGIDDKRIKTNSTIQNISFNNDAAKGGVYLIMKSSEKLTKISASTVSPPINIINTI